jgi:hydroxymethylpyrimidine pyrophosphatase-like HAD family hydrolase
MIKLALTDLDDTLIPLAHRGSASDRTIEAIHAMLDAGLHFGPVTGRTPSGVSATFHEDERCYATGAYANGQIVMLDGEVIHKEWCSAEALQRVADVMDELGEGALAVYDIEGPDRSGWFVSSDAARCEHGFGWKLNNYHTMPHVKAPMLKSNVHVLSSLPRERHIEIRDLLRREVPELDFVFPSNTAPLIDVTPKGYGKGSAAAILAEALSIGIDEIAVFGDSENDLVMLASVPNSVAVANASDEAKAAARWECGCSDDEGVADALLAIAAAAATGEMPSFMR